jgi:hypothetical protein
MYPINLLSHCDFFFALSDKNAPNFVIFSKSFDAHLPKRPKGIPYPQSSDFRISERNRDYAKFIYAKNRMKQASILLSSTDMTMQESAVPWAYSMLIILLRYLKNTMGKRQQITEIIIEYS